MRIQNHLLPTHLKKGLNPFYIVFGPEPYQKMEASDNIRKEAHQQGYIELKVFEITPHFDWEEWFWNLKTPSLFSTRRLIECRLMEGNLGKNATKILTTLAENPNTFSDSLFLFVVQKPEAKPENTEWFKALDQKGLSVFARTFSHPEFAIWVEKRLQQAGFNPSPEALEILIDRTEGNCLACAQSIEKLQLCYPKGPLTQNEIMQLISVDARFSLFDLVDATQSGSIDRTRRVFACLREEVEPSLVLWALSREVRTLIQIMCDIQSGQPMMQVLNKHNVWKHRVPLVTESIKRFTLQKLQKILIKAKKIDDIIKGYSLGNAWEELYYYCLTMAGATLETS